MLHVKAAEEVEPLPAAAARQVEKAVSRRGAAAEETLEEMLEGRPAEEEEEEEEMPRAVSGAAKSLTLFLHFMLNLADKP